MNVWGITHRGVVREENQDAFAVQSLSEHEALAVVCDGMGGARAGNVASALTVDIFLDGLLQDLREGELPPAQALERSAERANAAVYHRSRTDAECFGMGTTIVAAYVRDGTATVLNEGDSRAYHITAGGIQRITRDHSLVEDMVLRGDLTPDQARRHPHKNLITRALGADAQLQADLFERPVGEGEFLLLCSDGLSNTVTDQEILYEVLHGGAPADCCQRLLDISVSRGAPDNVTVALIQC